MYKMCMPFSFLKGRSEVLLKNIVRSIEIFRKFWDILGFLGTFWDIYRFLEGFLGKKLGEFPNRYFRAFFGILVSIPFATVVALALTRSQAK